MLIISYAFEDCLRLFFTSLAYKFRLLLRMQQHDLLLSFFGTFHWKYISTSLSLYSRMLQTTTRRPLYVFVLVLLSKLFFTSKLACYCCCCSCLTLFFSCIHNPIHYYSFFPDRKSVV